MLSKLTPHHDFVLTPAEVTVALKLVTSIDSGKCQPAPKTELNIGCVSNFASSVKRRPANAKEASPRLQLSPFTNHQHDFRTQA